MENLRQKIKQIEIHKAEINATQSFKFKSTKILSEQEACPPGTATTYCSCCRYTCHESCEYLAEEKKFARLWMMTDAQCVLKDVTILSIIMIPTS